MKTPSVTTGLYYLFVLTGLVRSTVLPGLPPSHEGSDNDRRVSPGLFESLEELARIVDISYCVGATGTGIQKPFECLSRCDEFREFELVTVCVYGPWLSLPSRRFTRIRTLTCSQTWNTGPLLSDSCGYIALSHSPNPKRIIVAFRGTYSVTNTIIDLSAVPQGYVPYPDPQDDARGGNAGEQNKCFNCTVHAGFLASWQTARDTVIPHIKAVKERYPDYKVVLVGHSLGGAVAALAGLEMQIRGWNPQVTTFGEPRIGNEALARFLDDRFNLTASRTDSMGKERRGHTMFLDDILQDGDEDVQYRRVTHANDPVPLLPLEEWGYEMHAGEIFISKLDLPPSVSDLQHCDGDYDPRCIAGSGSTTTSIFKDFIPFLRPPTKSNLDSIQAQSPLSPDNPDLNPETPDDSAQIQWSLLPARYRLWELFLAHRDYFYRLGLCIPGGDPSHFRGWEEPEKSTLNK